MLKHRAAATEADRAIELRDVGLSVLEAYGRWKPCGSRDLHMLTADVSNLLILYRVFMPPPAPGRNTVKQRIPQ